MRRVAIIALVLNEVRGLVVVIGILAANDWRIPGLPH